MVRNILTRKLLPPAWILAVATSCEIDSPGFSCETDAQCVSDDGMGVCEATGACSFDDPSCPEPGRRYGEHGPAELRDQCVTLAGFEEDFQWLGLHASTLPDQSSNTVWWPPDDWDVRGRTSYLGYSEGGFHADIRKSSADLTDGLPLDDRLVIGGDGSPGVGIMHFEGFGAVSARLRNPGVIANGSPLEVEFYTNRLTTIGDHWEIVLTPQDAMVGAEHTALSIWGLDHPADSVAVSLRGGTAFPCEWGWQQLMRLSVAQGGAVENSAAITIPGDPSYKDHLSQWRLRFFSDHVEAWADLESTGSLSLLHTFPQGVPWTTVHVHLVAVGNATADYPDDDACANVYTSKARDVAWKAVRVTPLLFGSTSVHPRQDGTDRVPLRTGWQGYDLRDIQRVGEVSGISQPNADPFNIEYSYAFCSDDTTLVCSAPTTSRSLEVEIPAWAMERLAHAQLNYDVRGDSPAVLVINDTQVGELPNRSLADLESPLEWQHRAVEVPIELLHSGLNSVRIDMDDGAQFGRLELELAKAR